MERQDEGRNPVREFTDQAGRAPRGLIREAIGLVVENRKLWLLPIIVALLAASAVIILGGTSLAPFIYALF